jgi:hypothetical protein
MKLWAVHYCPASHDNMGGANFNGEASWSSSGIRVKYVVMVDKRRDNSDFDR